MNRIVISEGFLQQLDCHNKAYWLAIVSNKHCYIEDAVRVVTLIDYSRRVRLCKRCISSMFRAPKRVEALC